MDANRFSQPIALKNYHVTDRFWTREMELVRTSVIPYQWEVLNDRVPEAAPSYCMHNFRAAARQNARRHADAEHFVPPHIPLKTFQTIPADPRKPEADRFYGFLFQDTDFSKWIEAVSYSLINHPDAKLEQTADEAIDIVCAAQLDDGYLDTYYIMNDMDQAIAHLRLNHELYCLGHLVEGAVAYYEATGKEKLLRAACRFADWMDQRLGREEGKKRGYPGHEIAEMALFKLYAVTGEERYRRLGSYFLDERGQEPHYFALEEIAEARADGRPEPKDDNPLRYAYFQAHLPVRQQDEVTGHAVRAMYLCAGMADAARLNQDEEMLAACERLWRSTVEEKLYITGGIGGTVHGEAFSYPYDLPNDAAYSETCAAIGLVFFARRMMQIKPDHRYADVMEQALYNTVLAGMALDGQSFFYVNPLEVVPEACKKDQRLSHVKPVRQKWFGCACCPPNIARLVASLPTYAVTCSEDTVYTHLYLGGEVEVLNGRMKLNVSTELPWNGKTTVSVTAENVQATLAFRFPGWTDQPTVTCEGKELAIREGYAYLTGVWQTGDTVQLDFPMRVRIMRAAASVREDNRQVAFVRGPITFCAEQHDNGQDLHLLRIDPASAAPVVLADETFGHATVRLRVQAQKAAAEQRTLYSEWQPEKHEPCIVELIPYYAWSNRGENEMRVWLETV